jgi:hypothetical protein
LEWLDQVRSGNSVSVHVRRGDYARNPQASKFHGVLNPEYYLQALSHLTRKYGSLEVFVFSDDLEWVRGNIRFDAPTHYVEGNARDASHIDMLLMSNCAHNIIANSTFSWWAGWLNARPGRTVVAPLQWFADKATDTRDICPPWFDRV